MRRWQLGFVFALSLSAIALEARADFQVLGVTGIPISYSAAETACWGTNVLGNTFGVRVNNCAGNPSDYKTIYYPLIYESTWATTWHAQIYASTGVGCGIFAEPDNGGVWPAGSGYAWSSGTFSPISVQVLTTYTAAYVHCFVPPGGYIVTVKWWLT